MPATTTTTTNTPLLLLKKARLILRLVTYSLSLLTQTLHQSLSTTLHRLLYNPLPEPSLKNVVVVGASFAGYHAAHLLATSLPPTHRVVVVEPHSHFHFTWVFPRFATVGGGGDGGGGGGGGGIGGGGVDGKGQQQDSPDPDPAHAAFIPYGPLLRRAPASSWSWKAAAVARVGQDSVILRDSGEPAVPYDYLVLATGGAAKPPSRLGVDGKAAGVDVLRGVRREVERAQSVVVVGGGAVGVEVATDARSAWPGKRVVLVHSRGEVLGRFGRGLRAAAAEAMGALGVEVVLGERVVKREEGEEGFVELSSGRRLPCDCLIDCTGQKPVSGILADLSPASIARSGHIRVKPTMQVADDSLPNVYAVGDVAETGVPKTNARSAMKQAKTAVDNILLAVKGQEPRNQYKYAWQDGAILLTLGLNKAVVNISDGETEMNFHTKGKDMSLYAASGWKHMGAKPFDDDYEVEKALD